MRTISVSACLLVVAGSVVACDEPTTDDAGLGRVAPSAPPPSPQPTILSTPTAPPITSTPTVDPGVTARLAQLPQQGHGAALIDAMESGSDWRGSLTGFLFEQPLGPPGWKLCFEILESYPEQCGSHVELDRVPGQYVADPASFVVQTGVDSEEPAVVISANPVTLTGTFDHATALFREDGDTVAPPTTVSAFAQSRLDVLPAGEPFDSIAASYSNGREWRGSLTGIVVETLAGVSSRPRLCFDFDPSASNPCPTFVEVSAPDALSLATPDAFSIVEVLGEPAGLARVSNEPITIEGTFTFRRASFRPDQ